MTTLDKARRFFVGVQVSPLRISAGLFDSTWRLQGKTKRSTKAERGADEVTRRVLRAIADVVDEADLQLTDVAAVGMAVCSKFSPEFAAPERPLAMRWKECSPLTALQRELKIPVHLVPMGVAAALGVSTSEIARKAERLAVLWIEAELSVGFISAGEVKPELERAVLGEDRWLCLGERLSAIPGKRRYRMLRSLMGEQDVEALALFERVVAQIGRVLQRCLDLYQPEVLALVGAGAEELKDELLPALSRQDPALGQRLAEAGCMIPALANSACRLGAAVFAANQLHWP